MMQGIGLEGFEIEKLRERLRKMTDEELLKFGKAARYMVSPRANMGKPPLPAFVLQLEEARAEWRRRQAFRQTGTSFENSAGGGVMEKKKQQFKRGDSVIIRLPVGQIVEVTIRAVIEETDGVHLQVDGGYDQTGLIHERDVVSP
jgi:hypothetical protein